MGKLNYQRLHTGIISLILVLFCGGNAITANAQDLPIRKGLTGGLTEKPSTKQGIKQIQKAESTFSPAFTPRPESPSEMKEIQIYKELIARTPDNASLYASLAYVHYKSHRFEAAIEYYQQAIQLTAHPLWCYHLGHALSESGRYMEAIGPFTQAVALNPQYDVARYDLSLAYLKAGKKKAAMEQLEILSTSNQYLADELSKQINRRAEGKR